MGKQDCLRRGKTTASWRVQLRNYISPQEFSHCYLAMSVFFNFERVILLYISKINFFWKRKVNIAYNLIGWLALGLRPVVCTTDLGLRGGVPSVGVFLRDPSPYLREFRGKPPENREFRQILTSTWTKALFNFLKFVVAILVPYPPITQYYV